jgi:hypothetical protein
VVTAVALVLELATGHGGRVEGVVLKIAVPQSWLKRHGGAAQGLWYSPRDIAPRHIRRVITFGELSRSPAEGAAPAA